MLLSRMQGQQLLNDPTRNNVASGYKTPNQKKRISALQSQGMADLLIENFSVILLFSNMIKVHPVPIT